MWPHRLSFSRRRDRHRDRPEVEAAKERRDEIEAGRIGQQNARPRADACLCGELTRHPARPVADIAPGPGVEPCRIVAAHHVGVEAERLGPPHAFGAFLQVVYDAAERFARDERACGLPASARPGGNHARVHLAVLELGIPPGGKWLIREDAFGLWRRLETAKTRLA